MFYYTIVSNYKHRHPSISIYFETGILDGITSSVTRIWYAIASSVTPIFHIIRNNN